MLEFEDFIMDCQLRSLSKATVKTYKVSVGNFIKYIKEEHSIDRISKIKTNHVKAYLLFKSSNCSACYMNNIIKALKVFFNYCIKEEYIIKNPLDRIEFLKQEQKIIETFTLKEVQNMLDSYDYSNYFNARNKAIIATMFETGIRSKETIDLVNEDILSDRIFIKGKGKKQRYVPSSLDLKRILKHYEKMKNIYFYKKQNLGENYFNSRTGKALTSKQMIEIYKQAGEKAGVRDKVRCSCHTMRHTFASEMIKKTDIYTVSRLLGHANVGITERYIQTITSGKLIDSINIISPLSMLKGGKK